jgi:uncharacterized protein
MIKSYSKTQVIINAETLEQDFLLYSKDEVTTSWSKQQQQDFVIAIEDKPELIIIGTDNKDFKIPLETKALMSQQRIAVEQMSLGAACKTYNILKEDDRYVILGVIF